MFARTSRHAVLSTVLSSSLTSLGLGLATTAAAQDPGVGRAAGLEEIVVTATRREERLLDVPIAITAYSQDQLTAQNIRNIDDLTRVTPGVNFTRPGYSSNLTPEPAIRGIASNTGGFTTGIYLDDTPLNTLKSANITGPIFPRLFDLDRVEVLKGPQGTLFGAGNMGGAIRFITPTPSLSEASLRGTVELSTTDGDEGYQVGLAGGAPIIDGKLGFYLSAYNERAPGWVDHRDSFTLELDREDSNWSRATVVNGAVRWDPTENLSITASALYQNEYVNDTHMYWVHTSDPDDGQYENRAAVRSPGTNEFFVPSLTIEWNLGPATLISNTSYLDRDTESDVDYTQEINAILTTGGPSAFEPLFPGQAMPAKYLNSHEVFTQELRLQSTGDSRLRWVAGVYYSDLEQDDQQLARGAESLDQTLLMLYGAGIEDVFGIPPYVGFGYDDLVYVVTDKPTQEQKAAYVQVDYELFENFTVTAGVRYSDVETTFDAFTGGPFNGANQSTSGSSTEDAWTPKFGVAWKPGETMYYANVSKGFRPGGAQPPPPAVFCAEDLANLGFDEPPTTYESDSLWSYELGAKGEVMDGLLRFDAAAYYIDWSNIQRAIPLPICTLNFIGNLGTVVSKGFELSVQANPADGLALGINVGYVEAENDESILSTPNSAGEQIYLAKEGQSLGAPEWKVAAVAQYDFNLLERESFVRMDVEYQSEGTEVFDPEVQGYNPFTAVNGEDFTVVKLRAGMTFGMMQLVAYIDNVFDENPVLSVGNYSTTSEYLYQTTLLPRTFGVRANFSF